MAARVFFSFSHKDEALRDQLETHLAMLKRQGLVESWHDRRMTAGSQLNWEIDKELNAADIILLLLSPDFLASDYCYKIEKARALERHSEGSARLISIVLRPCEWMHTDLAAYVVTPKDGRPISQWPDRDSAFLDVTTSIRLAIEEIGKAGPPLETHNWVERAAPSAPPPSLPRSSNLRLAKQFTQADKDNFRDEAFEYLAKFFEGSLAELQSRNENIQTRFRRVDANKFTAAIYRSGGKVASCTIRIGGHFSGGIAYAQGDDAGDNTLNDELRIECDDQKLFLSLMSFMSAGSNEKYSLEGAAEHYWHFLIRPLQGK
jgi:hypothetical protein